MGFHPYTNERKTKCTLGGEPDHDMLQPDQAYVNP